MQVYINEISYFAPMFSPKENHKKYRNNLSFFKMYGDKQEKEYLGIIRFTDMIPIPEKEVKQIDYKNKDIKYKMLLNKQYNYINKTNNKNEILKKAKKIYDIIKSNKKTKITLFYKKLCCDFNLLEKKYFEYKN